MKYTQGVCNDAAAILRDGARMTIDEVIEKLNSIDKLEAVRAAATKYHDWLQGLTLRDRWGLADALNEVDK